MVAKRKLNITLDEAAHRKKLACSQLIQKALRLWIKNKTEKQMAAGYDEMTEEDRLLAEEAVSAQSEILS